MASSTTAVTVSAPGSVGILGDPGDLFGGAVLACAVAPAISVTVSQSPALEVWHGERAIVFNWVGDLKVRGDEFDAVRAVLRYLDWDMEPVRIACSGGPCWGFGDATPTLVALLKALSAWKGLDLTPYSIAEAACSLERDVFGLAGSPMAACMAAFGGLRFLEFQGMGDGDRQSGVYAVVENLSPFAQNPPFAAARLGAARPARDALIGLRERWMAGEERVVDSYAIIARLAREGKKALLDGNWARLGQLMNENAIIQSNLTATDWASERLAKIALEAGALGIRPLGAGKSGSVVALHLCPEELVAAWEAAGAEIVPILVGKENEHD